MSAPVVIMVDSLVPRQALARLSEAMGTPFILNLLGARLLSFVDESFRTRGRGRWARLAWSTIALRARGGDEPLQNINYRQSFVMESDQRTAVEVGSNFKTGTGIPLSLIHERGTGPYIIRPRNAKVLAARLTRPLGLIPGGRMTGTNNAPGFLFFGKEVHHPGVPARPVLPTQAEAEQILRPVVEGALERAVQPGGPGGGA